MIDTPVAYVDHPVLSGIAKALVEERKVPVVVYKELNKEPCPLRVYGIGIIETGALSQINIASRLPVSVKAALMPDAHSGYGLPLGGVLATDNSVIPYAVGLDIGCRMQMSVFDIPESATSQMHDYLVGVLNSNTIFGVGQPMDVDIGHPVLQDEAFDIPALKRMKLLENAKRSLGTSGAGNHFVEFGITTMPETGRRCLAVLSHSGSRGVGAKIGEVYTKIAMDKCGLEEQAKYLAWLSLDDEDGKEYWSAMTMAGAFAKANHDIIHSRIEHALGVVKIARFENFHNFAWKEIVNGQEVIVHRKGATPAGLGTVGLIPGSNSTPTYIVRGKGNLDSMCSSSHGAGRKMSCTVARNTFTMEQFRENLREAGVTLIGGSLDECSMAYKNIDEVMQYQTELVDAIGSFDPWIVRMAEENKKPWEK